VAVAEYCIAVEDAPGHNSTSESVLPLVTKEYVFAPPLTSTDCMHPAVMSIVVGPPVGSDRPAQLEAYAVADTIA
jgi:hypothetical protein